MGEIAWEHLSPMEIWRLLHFHPELRDEYEKSQRIENIDKTYTAWYTKI